MVEPKINPLDQLTEMAKHTPRGRLGCVTAALLEHPEHTDLILGAVAHTAPASVVSKFLENDYGIRLAQSAISRHRRDDCSCRHATT